MYPSGTRSGLEIATPEEKGKKSELSRVHPERDAAGREAVEGKGEALSGAFETEPVGVEKNRTMEGADGSPGLNEKERKRRAQHEEKVRRRAP